MSQSGGAQFTPGPWHPHLAKADHCLSSSVWGAEPGNQVAVIGGKSLQTMNANATLIAAAPAMYEALKEWCDYYAAYNPIRDKRIEPFIQLTRKALAQAEGRQG